MVIPTDTVFETDPVYGFLHPKAIDLFKRLLLEFGKLHRIEGMTPTQLINAMEGCRRRGYLKIYQLDDGDFQIKLTPTGAATAFLDKLK